MEHSFFSYRPSDLERIPMRPEQSNKGTFGRVLVIGGSPCMSGAAYFSAKAAYRTGAGLVQILTHADNRVILQTQLPEAILTVHGDRPEEQKLNKEGSGLFLLYGLLDKKRHFKLLKHSVSFLISRSG